MPLMRHGNFARPNSVHVSVSDDEFNVHTGFDCTLKFPVPLSEALHGTLAQHKVALRFELHFNAKDPYALRKVGA